MYYDPSYSLQGTGLQGQAVFRTKLSFRPHSTDSQTHKKMTLSMADRSSKTNGGGLKAGPGKPVYSSGSDSDSGDSRKGGKSSEAGALQYFLIDLFNI